MQLSVIIPVYNEKGTLLQVVEAVQAASVAVHEIIIVDDGSTDGSCERLEERLPSPLCRVIRHSKNQGKGAAIRTGLKAATGELVVIQDADLEYSPREYGKLMDPILRNEADIVYGSRFMNRGNSALWLNRLGNWGLTRICNVFTGLRLTDMETCYKMMRRSAIEGIEIHENRFGVEPELTVKFAKKGLRIKEVPIAYTGRNHQEGKKIRWWDGVRTVYAILKYTFFS